jgi:protein-tyrosine-phosphatase
MTESPAVPTTPRPTDTLGEPHSRPSWSDLPLEQTVALRAAATRLQENFVDVFGVETVERFLHSSFDQFASRATVPQFLPLMAERFARQRLRALAKIEGLRDDGKPTVLFLCVHNAGRSQMALGFFSHLAGDRAVAWSGGSEPGMQVNPVAVEAMRERGIDISTEFPKPWTDETVRAADVVITMGCGDACPIFPGKRYEEWVLDDPAGRAIDDVRAVRDDIERRVRKLLDELDVPVS